MNSTYSIDALPLLPRNEASACYSNSPSVHHHLQSFHYPFVRPYGLYGIDILKLFRTVSQFYSMKQEDTAPKQAIALFGMLEISEYIFCDL